MSASRLYVDVVALPATLQRALASVGYGRKNISVEASETYSPLVAGGDGYRGFCVAVNLATGETRGSRGSWGGANAFSPGNAVDLDSGEHPLAPGFAVINGHEGGSRPVWAGLTVHPGDLAPLLPAGAPELSEDEKRALGIIAGFKGGYRADEFRRYGLEYDPAGTLLRGLERKGLVKINRAGGVQVTTAGRNAAPRHW